MTDTFNQPVTHHVTVTFPDLKPLFEMLNKANETIEALIAERSAATSRAKVEAWAVVEKAGNYIHEIYACQRDADAFVNDGRSKSFRVAHLVEAPMPPPPPAKND